MKRDLQKDKDKGGRVKEVKRELQREKGRTRIKGAG